MLILILGLVLLLGAHTFITFRSTRSALIARHGLQLFRAVHSAVSLLGFVLIVWGFHRYREDGLVQVWNPPAGMAHMTMLLMWIAFVILATGPKRPSRIRGWVRHPMLTAVMLWGFGHLLANGDLGGMILFASVLAWAVYDRLAVAQRGDAGAAPVARFTRADAVALAAGTVAWAAMIVLHPVLIGVSVIPGL